MKLNHKGMAVSFMIYSILLLFLVLMFGILGLLGTRKVNLDRLKHEVLSNLNSNEGTPISINSYIQEGKILHYDGYIEPVLDNGVLVWKDLSGNDNHAKLQNFNQEKAWDGKGIVLDGVDDILSYMGTLTDTYTIEIVAQVDLEAKKTVLFGAENYPTLYLSPNLDYRFALSDDRVFNTTLSAYQLHTITITSNKTNTYLYVDGVQSDVSFPSLGGSVVDAYLGGLGMDHFKGIIYSYMIYNRPLSDYEIQMNNYIHHIRFPYEKHKGDIDLYVQDHLMVHYDGYTKPENQLWNDVSGNGNHATLVGIDDTSGFQENGIVLDGIDDFITTSLTLSSTEGTVSVLVSNYKDTGSIFSSNVNVKTEMYSNSMIVGENPGKSISYPIYLNSDIHQITLEWKTENTKRLMTVYFDGILVEENVELHVSTDGSYFTIGSSVFLEQSFANIKVYNLKYYNKALNSHEIKLNYALDKTRYID